MQGIPLWRTWQTRIWVRTRSQSQLHSHRLKTWCLRVWRRAKTVGWYAEWPHYFEVQIASLVVWQKIEIEHLRRSDCDCGELPFDDHYIPEVPSRVSSVVSRKTTNLTMLPKLIEGAKVDTEGAERSASVNSKQ